MNLKKSAKKLIAELAPTIGMALTGGNPLGGMAGKFVADALGVDPTKLEETILAGDPGAMLKVKEAEQAFTAEMERLGLDVEKLHQQDRASARELAQATSLVPQIVLSVIFVVGYFGIVIGLLTQTFTIPEDAGTLISALIGVLTAGVIKVLDFFLGSSAGSKLKTALNGRGSM
jgi:F0F1-type ATP synthase assembly protein I